MSRIAVLGAGAWGTGTDAVARHRRGAPASFVSGRIFRPAAEENSNEVDETIVRYLPGFALPADILITSDLLRRPPPTSTFCFVSRLRNIFATPSPRLRLCLRQIRSSYRRQRALRKDAPAHVAGYRVDHRHSVCRPLRTILCSGGCCRQSYCSGCNSACTRTCAQMIQREFSSASAARLYQ